MGAVVLALLVSCSNPYFIWVAPGSTASHLTFAHAWQEGGRSSASTGYLWVETCERIAPDLMRTRSRREWTAEWKYADSLRPEGPLTVTYGTQPFGSGRAHGAAALPPGCYSAVISVPGGNGRVTFWVKEDLSVVPFTPQELDSTYALIRQHQTLEIAADTAAHQLCLERYRSAGSDTGARRRADRSFAYDTARFSQLRCEDLARYDTLLVLAGATPVPEGAEPPRWMHGDFEDDYGNRFLISRWEWTQMPHGKLRVVKWVPSHSYLVAQNDSGNTHAPGLWTRIDWVTLDSMAPWTWAFCLSAYEAPTADSAEATRVARPATPRTGCNGYPYSRMQRVVRPGQGSADSLAKQKCREAYAAVGGDGAGLQDVDDMIPYDTTKAIGRSCGWLRRQDPRLRGAE
jgi:hypothetical protein